MRDRVALHLKEVTNRSLYFHVQFLELSTIFTMHLKIIIEIDKHSYCHKLHQRDIQLRKGVDKRCELS